MPRSGIVRALAACCLLALSLGPGVGCPGGIPAPEPGAPEYQSAGWVRVPFARVNALGGNLLVERRDLDLDTRLGNLALGAVWNSADAAWRFGFELSYDGATLVDATGARHALAGIADGEAVPGTLWVRLDARTLRTKGGLVHEFDTEGRLAALHWSSGAYPRLEYRRAVAAGASRLLEIRQWPRAGESVRLASFGYDAGGRLVTIDDRAGRRAAFAWSAEGRLVAARDPLDVERGWPGFRYAYSGLQLVAITSSEGVRAEFVYAGSRVSEARALGEGDPRVRFAYAKAGGGFRTTVTDPLGNASRLSWDASRRLLVLENALGERSRWTWEGLRPSSFAGPDGAVTHWLWAAELPVLEIQPSGNAVSFAWERGAENRADPAAAPLRRASDALGLVREHAFDASGRLVRTTNGAGESWSYAWNAENLVSASTDPAGVETRFEDHGEHGHPRRIERAGRAETRDYDAVGNLLVGAGSAALPGAGDTGIVSRGYDADRNLATLVLGDLDSGMAPATRNLTVRYRSDGQPLRIERPEGGDSEFDYDALGRARERRDRSAGAWRATRLERDLLGRTTAVIRPNGMETRVQYDAAGRRSALLHLRGGSFESGAAFSWASGRLASIADAAHGYAPESYAYDAAGRLQRVVYPGGERLELSFDLRSRPVEERYLASSGAELRRLRFAYDLADRETELRDGGALLRGLGFAGGRVGEERFGNGLVRAYAYGAADGLLRDVTLRDASGGLVERTRAEQGSSDDPLLLRWQAETTSFGALPATSHEHFLMAPLGPGAPGPRVAGFASDAAGQDVLWFAYDALGNLTRIGSAGDASRLTFHYDAEATRLLRVRRASGATVHEYAYDEAGFAVSRDGEAVLWDAAGRAAGLGTRARFRWDALGRLVEATQEGVGQRRLFGGRVRASAAGVPLAIELGALEVGLLGAHRYRHLDFRGNVKLVSDAAGRIVSHVRYGPYGPDRSDGAPDPEAGFAQGRAAGDLLLLGARLYDPDAARFLAPDPLLQLVNQYAYADGNPVWYWDPDGRSPQAATAVALGVALGVSVVAAITGNVPLVVFAAGVAAGLLAPPTATGAAVAGGAGVGVRFSGLPIALQAPFAGFVVGQSLSAAFHHDLGDTTLPDVSDKPPRDLPNRPRDVAFPEDGRGTAVGGGGGEGGPSGGCSPASLALPGALAPPDALLALIEIQVLLGGALAWQRRRR